MAVIVHLAAQKNQNVHCWKTQQSSESRKPAGIILIAGLFTSPLHYEKEF